MGSSEQHFEPDEFHEAAGPGKFVQRLVIGLVVLGAIVAYRYAGPSHALASNGWIADWNQAVEASRSSGKPALVLFTADWCGACRQLESETLRDQRVKDYLAANYTLAVVDLSDRSGANNERAAKFGIRSIPTLVVYNKSGLEAARSHGMAPDDLIDWLRSHQ